MERRVAVAFEPVKEAGRFKVNDLCQIEDQPSGLVVVIPMVRADREPVLEVLQLHVDHARQAQPSGDLSRSSFARTNAGTMLGPLVPRTPGEPDQSEGLKRMGESPT